MIKLKKQFLLLKKRELYERLDFYPFLILKILILFVLVFYKVKYISYYIIIFGAVYFLQICLILMKKIFINFKVLIDFYSSNNIDNATHVKVSIISNYIHLNNKIIICKIIRECNIVKIEIDKLIYI